MIHTQVVDFICICLYLGVICSCISTLISYYGDDSTGMMIMLIFFFSIMCVAILYVIIGLIYVIIGLISMGCREYKAAKAREASRESLL